MRGVLAVDEAFCLISHYPRDSHAPHSVFSAGRARRGGAGAGLLHRRSSGVERRRRRRARRLGGLAERRGRGRRDLECRETRPARRTPSAGVRRAARRTARAPALPRRRTPIAVRVPHVRMCERRHRKIKDIYEINIIVKRNVQRRNHERQIIIQQTSFSRGAAGAGVCMRASGNACERGPRTYGSVYC